MNDEDGEMVKEVSKPVKKRYGPSYGLNYVLILVSYQFQDTIWYIITTYLPIKQPSISSSI